MTIEKRGKSYRIKEMVMGTTYTVTVPYKPSKKEAYELIQAKINHAPGVMNFREASREYIETKKAVLSPSTITGYESIHKNIPEWF